MLKEGNAPQNEWTKTTAPLIPTALYVRAACYTQAILDEQREDLEQFATSNNMKIVRRYIEGGQPDKELKTLIKTVTTGSADFTAILMRDITRWGRFWDTDSSAYYEYICCRAGIAIRYAQGGVVIPYHQQPALFAK